MFTFESFSFSGDKFYHENTEVPLSLPGLTLLKGINFDGDPDARTDKNTAGHAASNGTGKTRLMQILEGFIFGRNPRGHFKKTVLPSFSGTLKFTDRDGHAWSFTYSVKDGWEILKNDAPVKISHKASDCQEKLQKLIGITREEWAYFIHINSQSLNILMRGKPTERRAYLEGFFCIDSFYAAKFEGYSADWKRVKETIAHLKAERVRLEDVKLALAKLPEHDTIAELLVKCDEDIAALKEEISPLSGEHVAILGNLESWASHQALFLQLQGIDAEELRGERKSLMERKIELERLQKNRIALDLHMGRKLNPHVSIKPKRTENKPEEQRPTREYITERGVILSQMREKLRLKKLIAPLAKEIAEAEGSLTMDAAEIEARKATLSREKSDLQEHYNLLKDGGDICPTCKQSLDFLLEGLSIDEKVKAIGLRLSEIKNLEWECLDQRRRRQAYDKTLQQHATLLAEFSRFPNFGVKLADAEAEVEALNALAKSWEVYSKESEAEKQWRAAYEIFLSEAKALGWPEALESDYKGELSEATERLSSLEEELKQFERFDALTDTVIGLPPQAELEKSREGIGAALNLLSSKVDALSEQKGVLRTQLASVIELKEREGELLKTLASTESVERECKILETLNSFYSPSGFKVYELKRRCVRMIERANFWSKLFFQEPYIWSMSEDLDDLDFFIQPMNDPNTEPYPVSLLSSGEFNRGARVLLFSQLELIPPQKKTNFLALDEIESNLDKTGLLAFTDVVLPRLKETFKDRTIIVISHQESLHNGGVLDHLFVAERRNRKTTLTVYPYYQRRGG